MAATASLTPQPDQRSLNRCCRLSVRSWCLTVQSWCLSVRLCPLSVRRSLCLSVRLCRLSVRLSPLRPPRRGWRPMALRHPTPDPSGLRPLRNSMDSCGRRRLLYRKSRSHFYELGKHTSMVWIRPPYCLHRTFGIR